MISLMAAGCFLVANGSVIAFAQETTEEQGSAIAGIDSDIDNYIHRLSDDELGIAANDRKNKHSSASKDYPEFAGKCMAVVDNSLNVRAEGSTDAAIVGKMQRSSVADVVEKGAEWTKISSGNVEGYVSTEFLVFDNDAGEYAHEICTMIATVNADSLKVRKEQSTDSGIITQVGNGLDLEVIEEYDEWVQVRTEEGDVGYVFKEFVDIHFGTTTAVTLEELRSQQRQKIINYAMNFVGNPYVWGGTSLTNGTDCSGFTMRVYQHFGYNLNRTSGAQYSNGVPVGLDELVPGDLVFYAYSNGRIHHVAIYIGNGQIVHASTESTGIIVSSMYIQTPCGARRIIN